MMLVAPSFGVKGFLKLQTFNKFSGKCRIDTGFFPNSVLNAGRNRMGSFDDWFNCGQVGSNNTAPSPTDTGMLGYIAGTNVIQFQSYGAQASPPYYGWRQRTFRHAAGSTAANLSEAGTGWANSGAALWNRGLIVDLLGVPTTITPLSDEVLDLTVQLRYYPPLADVTGTIVIDGINYNYAIRAAEVNSAAAWGNNIGVAVGEACVFASDWAAYDGEPGTLVQIPSGLSDGIDNVANVVNQVYSNNSYQRDMSFNVGPSGWVNVLGIRTILMRTTAGSFQTRFGAVAGDARIPKTSGKTINGVFRVGWTEAVIP